MPFEPLSPRYGTDQRSPEDLARGVGGLAIAFKFIESSPRSLADVNTAHLVALVRAGAAFSGLPSFRRHTGIIVSSST
jgi:hypothetical protein